MRELKTALEEPVMRKIFNKNNWTESRIINWSKKKQMFENTISAAGILFWRIYQDKLQLLLIDELPKSETEEYRGFEDFGGKVEIFDKTVFDTIIREAFEESNGLIRKSFIEKIIKERRYKLFYTKKSKYLIMLSQIKNEYYHSNDNKDNAQWRDYNSVKNRLMWRLQNDNLFKFLEDQKK